MKPEAQEWIEKAARDLKVARREGQTADPVYDAVCFTLSNVQKST